MGSLLRGRGRVLVAALAVVLLIVPVALILSGSRASGASSTLTVIAGTTEIAPTGGPFSVAADGALINPGDRVRTGAGAHAVVTFFDGSTITLEPGTTVTIDEAAGAPDGAITITISQAVGRTWASVNRLINPTSSFQIRTPTSTAGVRGTGFITEVRPDGSSFVQTTDGSVEVAAQGRSVTVGRGQATTVAPSAPPLAPFAAPPPANTLRFGVHSPAYLAVVDPLGRACGLVLPGPAFVRQIPGCLATPAGVEPQLVDVPNAAGGTYQLVVFPRGDGGPYTLTASGSRGADLTFNYSVAGRIAVGEKQGSSINISASANGTLGATGLSNVATLERTTLKVVVPSAAPRATAVASSATPDRALFAPLPAIGFSIGPTVTPVPAVSVSATGSPVPAASPSPTPTAPASASPSPSPTATPSSSPALSPSPAGSPTSTPSALPALTALPTLTPLPVLSPTPAPSPSPTPTATPSPTPSPSPTPVPVPVIARPAVPATGLVIHGRVTNASGAGVGNACVTLGPPIRCWTRTSTGSASDTGYFVINLSDVAATPGGSWDYYVVQTSCGQYYSGVFVVNGVIQKDATLSGPC